jgi:hypothetical protein
MARALSRYSCECTSILEAMRGMGLAIVAGLSDNHTIETKEMASP